MSQLPCISIQHPWAWAISEGTKRVENRCTRSSRRGVPNPPTRHRGLIGIHASTKIDIDAMQDQRILELIRYLYGGQDLKVRDILPTGVIIGVAKITDCHHDNGRCCGQWAARGQWHIILDHVKPLETPVRASGSLGLPWYAPDSVTAAVMEQIVIGVRR